MSLDAIFISSINPCSEVTVLLPCQYCELMPAAGLHGGRTSHMTTISRMLNLFSSLKDEHRLPDGIQLICNLADDIEFENYAALTAPKGWEYPGNTAGSRPQVALPGHLAILLPFSHSNTPTESNLLARDIQESCRQRLAPSPSRLCFTSCCLESPRCLPGLTTE